VVIWLDLLLNIYSDSWGLTKVSIMSGIQEMHSKLSKSMSVVVFNQLTRRCTAILSMPAGGPYRECLRRSPSGGPVHNSEL